MTITAIGTRRALTPAGMESVDLDVRGALQGSSLYATVPADDTQVYALRFLGETRDSMLLEVAAAQREGLRHASTSTEIDAFLKTLGDTVRAQRGGARPPDDLARTTTRARSDLKQLAALYPFLAADPHDQWHLMESDMQKALHHLFVDEIAVAKGLTQDRAAAMLDAVLQ
jgi:RNA polymerase-interacting CarD/CdnL/TRCF family regulator